MDTQDLKRYISKMTGVPLVREGMADVAGVRNIKNRQGLQWEEFQPGSVDVPPLVASELGNLMKDFQSKFHEFAGTENVRMIWAYVTKDESIQKAHKDVIEQSNDPRKDQFKGIIEWMNKYGVRLWMSPSAIDRHRQKSGDNIQDSSNTSDKWLEQFGYIWGLKKKGDYRNKRESHDISDEHAELIKNDPATMEKMKSSNQRIGKVETAQMNGAFGIFFDVDGQLIPVIGSDYYATSGSNHHNRDWVNWDSFRQESGQHSKFFGTQTQDDLGNIQKSLVYPTSSQFFLPNGEQDSSPQAISKSELKSTVADKAEYVWNNNGTEIMIPSNEISKSPDARASYVWNKPDGKPVIIPSKQLTIKEQPLYYLWIKNDGTLWWVPKDKRNEVAGKERKTVKKREGAEAGQPFPLTREQVDFFNMYKGKHVRLTNPHTHVYSWDTLPERTPEEKQEKQEKQQDWQDKTHIMNQLYDFLADHPKLPPLDVRLQATKYVIIGPQFKKADNTGVQETMGRMKSHHTLIQDVTPGSDDHFAVRKGWVIVGGEFNAARAEARGEKGLAPAQSIDGLGPLTPRANVFEAVNDAFSSWKINCAKPNSGELQAAQQAFDMAHGMVAQPPKKQNAIPTLNDQDTKQFGQPPKQPMPFLTPQQPRMQQQVNISRPQVQAPPAPMQQVMPKQNEELATASRKSLMLKSASLVIRNFKRLG